MELLNRFLNGAFDIGLAPFASRPPLLAIAVAALITSVGMLLIFKTTSNQERLAAVKRLLHAGIYEIRLFRDDARAIARAQLDILKHSARYLGLSLPPMLWMIVPLFFVVAQLQFRLAYDPLEPGQRAIVKAELTDGQSDTPSLVLAPSPGIRLDSELLWIPTKSEANWRILVAEPGVHSVRVGVGGQEFEKRVSASGGLARRSPVRPSSSLLGQLIYPAEEPLPDGAPLRAITVEYPELRVSIFGWRMHWLVAFLIFTLLFTLVLRTPLRVTI